MQKSNKKYKIFISYAHVDNEAIDGEEWVTGIVNDLNLFLAQKLGRKEYFDIWFDKTSLDGNVHLTPELKDKVCKSDLFVMILSQGYIHSHWCIEEFQIFIDKHPQYTEQSNIFIIQKDNIPIKRKPKEIQDIIGYSFWYKDKRGIVRTLFKNQKDTYYSLIASITEDMSQCIRSPIKIRKKEIKYFLQKNNLNTASIRLMDFASDFSEESYKNKATEIRKTFNSLLKENIDFKISNQLKQEILKFIETIEEEFKDDKKIKKQKSFFNAKEKFYKKKEIIFKATAISKKYKIFNLKPINIELKNAEITALVGENGNGKTTLLNMIAGKLIPSSGTIEFPLLTDEKRDNWYHIKNQIAYITQELPRWSGSLKENLHFTLGINGIKGKKNLDEVEFILHRLELEKYSHATWNELSGGFKMRFALAKAILRNPKLLILDEPLANLDIEAQNLFLNDLKNLSASIKNEMTVILSSQNIYKIEEIADNIIFLKNGESLYNGKIKDFGKNIQENSYEFNLDIEEEKLLTILTQITYKEIEKNGQNYIIKTTKDITNDILLQLFLSHNIHIKYFRDISKSTRRLFGGIK